MRTTEQSTWNPGLEHGELTLGAVYAGMPRDDAGAVPWYVRLLENPESPLALPGAIDLFGHDCVHVLLGRGLLPQDEAFVLGFTMGTSGGCAWQAALFRWCAQKIYSGAYRFSELEGEVFSFAVEAGRASACAPLACVDFRSRLSSSVAALRRELGLDAAALTERYEAERERWPGTVASLRLPRRLTRRRAALMPPARSALVRAAQPLPQDR